MAVATRTATFVSSEAHMRSPMKTLLLVLAITVLPIGVAEAQPRYGNCFWDGQGPFCAGQCPPGFVVQDTSRKTSTGGCISGHAVQCCEPMGFRSQYQRREKSTAAEEVKQRKGAGSLKLPESTAGEKDTNRPVPIR
jgi:hypothetical protein